MIGTLPSDVPGLYQFAGRLDQFNLLMKDLTSKMKVINKDISVAGLGSGKVIFGPDVLKVLEFAGIQRETMTDEGLQFNRRRDKDGWIYFISNPTQNKAIQAWVPLSVNGKSAAIYDAMSGLTGMAAFRIKSNTSEIYLQLEPGGSIIVKVFENKEQNRNFRYLIPEGNPIPVNGKWTVTFLSGGETIPHPEVKEKLSSWTEWDSDQKAALKGFAGVARYSITFPGPTFKADNYYIYLGEVCHTARITLNGVLLGDVLANPMRVLCGHELVKGINTLDIEVANTPINRIADMDIRGIDWYYKTQDYDISGCEWDYAKKDSTWVPQRSGLLGPVEIIPVRFMKLKEPEKRSE